jgi:hypothetical protein
MLSLGLLARSSWRAGILGATVAAALTLSPRVVSAQQVSEADRQAARDLWQTGYQLQQAGNYAEALDKFKRAQAVFSAPTNLLHIAECEAQLGLLVESAETYRGLIGMPLPQGAPAAFGAAQTEAKAELQQVEARIPKIRIEVSPANAQNVGVTIDDQPMNAALLGVDRPIDPGTHKVHVFAPNYVPQDKMVVIKEKEPARVIAFSLVPGVSGVTYGPPPMGLPRTVVVQQPPMMYPPTYAVPAGQPYVLAPRPWTPPPPHDWTYTGFMVGARLGAGVPVGSLSSVAGPGFDLGAEAYFRFAHKWFTGLVVQHDFYGKGTAGADVPGSTLAAADIGFTTNPEGVGFTMDFFAGYRWFNDGGGGEAGLGAGVWIAAGKSLRIIPRVEISGGSDSDTNVGGYAIFQAGVSILYNVDIKPKVVVVAPLTVEPAKTE